MGKTINLLKARKPRIVIEFDDIPLYDKIIRKVKIASAKDGVSMKTFLIRYLNKLGG